MKIALSQAWWHVPLLQALQKQKQIDLSEFKASLVYIRQTEQHSKTVSQNIKKKKCKIGPRYTLIKLQKAKDRKRQQRKEGKWWQSSICVN